MNGDVDLGVVWSGEGAILVNSDKKFAFVVPEEGAHQFIDSLAIPKGAPNVAGAHLFIDYILRPDVSKLISEKFPYTNPNAEARKLLTPEQLKNPASYPELKNRTTFRDIGKAGSVLDALVATGANQINGPVLGLDNPDAAMDEARLDAIAKARARAELYAKAAGLKVKRILSISEGSFEAPRPMPIMMRMQASAADMPESKILAGEQSLTVSVSVRFELE